MTDAEIDAMEPGLVMDLAVCAACKIPAHEYYGDCHVDPEDNDAWRPGGVSPSYDWEYAIFAAERFGLFDTYCRAMSKDSDGWYVWCFDTEPSASDIERHIVLAPTGPLAICRAIMKLARKETA